MGNPVNVFLVPLVLLALAETIGAIGIFIVPVLAPEAAKDLGIDANLVGSYTSLLFFGAMISSALSGDLVSRWGAIRTNQLGLAGIAASLGLTTMATVPTFAMAGFGLGLAYGLFTPSATHVLARCTPPRFLALVLSIKQSGFPLGGALAGIAAPAAALAFDWRVAVVGVGAICVMAAAMLQLLRMRFDDDLGPKRRIAFRDLFRSWGLVLRNTRLRAVSVTGAAYAAMQNCFGALLVVYLVDGLGVDLVTAGLAQATVQVAGIVGRIGWSVLARGAESGARVLGLLGLAMSAAALVTTLFTAEWPVAALLLASAVLGATASGWSGVYVAQTARWAPPGETMQAIAGGASITFVGAVVGPAGFGALAAATDSYATGFAASALITALSAFVLLRSKPPRSDGPISGP